MTKSIETAKDLTRKGLLKQALNFLNETNKKEISEISSIINRELFPTYNFLATEEKNTHLPLYDFLKNERVNYLKSEIQKYYNKN